LNARFRRDVALTIACHPPAVDNRRTNNKEGPL